MPRSFLPRLGGVPGCRPFFLAEGWAPAAPAAGAAAPSPAGAGGAPAADGASGLVLASFGLPSRGFLPSPAGGAPAAACSGAPGAFSGAALSGFLAMVFFSLLQINRCAAAAAHRRDQESGVRSQ